MSYGHMSPARVLAFKEPAESTTLAHAVFDVPSVVNEPTAVLDQVRDGVEVARLVPVMEALGTNQQEIAELLGTSAKTVARLRKSGGKLDLRASDRTARLVRVFDRAAGVLGDAGRARAWLGEPNDALGGSAPLKWLDTDAGTVEVMNLLGRIEHGIFS